MRIPAEVPSFALKTFTQAELHCSPKELFRGVRLNGSSVDPGYIYIIRGEEATDPQEMRTLLTIGAPALAPARYIQVDEGTDPLRILEELQEVFVRFPTMDAELARAAMEDGYDALLEEAARILGNNISMTDSNNRVRASVHYGGTAQSDRRYFGGLRELRRHGDEEFANSLTEPTEYRFPYFGAPCIITNLFVNEKRVGRLVVVCHLISPNPKMRFLCSLLAVYLQRKIEKDEDFGYIRADDPVYSMFYDLIMGMRLAGELIQARLRELPGWDSGVYRVLAISMKDEVVSFEYFSSELKKEFDSYCVLAEDMLYCVFHEVEEKDAWASLEQRLEEFLAACEQKGGLSNVFRRFEELHERAEQARTALKLRKGEQLSIYTHKMMEHIMTFLPVESRFLLVHPALYRLRDIDRQQGTAYLETLEAYLESERSLTGTAEKLFIHRNTLLYRLEKLRTQVWLDLDDPQTRLHLLLSYRMMKDIPQEDNG